MSEARKRFNRFPAKGEIEWLDHDQRKKHRKTIQILTDLSLALEKDDPLSPEQDSMVQTLTGSEAKDTRLNAMWDMLEQTESHYHLKLSAMAPHDLTAYHEFMNPHEPPAHHHIFMCDRLMAVERGEIPTLIMAWPPGAAKLKPLDSPVVMGDGSTKPLGEVVVGDVVQTLSGRARKVLEATEATEARLIKIELEDGTVLRCDENHSWPTQRGNVKAVNLTKADSILAPNTWNVEDTSNLTEENVAEEVERLTQIRPCGGNSKDPLINKRYTIDERIYRLNNDRLRREFLVPFLQKKMLAYMRRDSKTPITRFELTHPSLDVISGLQLLLRRLGVSVKRVTTRRGSTLKFTSEAVEAVYSGIVAMKVDVERETVVPFTKWDFLTTGLMIGDGSSINRYSCTFTNQDEEILSLFVDLFQDNHGITFRTYPRQRGEGELCYTLVGRKDFGDWCDSRGILGKGSNSKRVPGWVFNGTHEQILYFLSGCFLTDGTIHLGKPTKGRKSPKVVWNISHTNEELIDDYVRLFELIGYSPKKGIRSTEYKGEPYPYWEVRLNRRDIHRFVRDGFLLGKKKRRVEEYFEKNTLRTSSPSDSYTGHPIKNIVFTDEIVPMRCLRVEEDATFLCEGGIATHNSTYASRSFAQWYMGRNPDKRILATSHSQRFGEDEFSKPNRNAINTERYRMVFPDVFLNPLEKGAPFWRLEDFRGNYAVRGAMAGASGLRAHIVLGDDLFKNAQDAMSATIREGIWRWWTTDIMSRRLPGAPVVLVNTLWSSEDVPNRIKQMYEEDPESIATPFEFINIPAEAEEDDPLGRAPGEWLWCIDQQEDGFYTIKDYITKRNSMPPSMWSALYLGKPLDRFGDFISEDEFHSYERPPINRSGKQMEWSKTVLSIDTASKGKDRSDYTAILVFRKHVDGTHYLVDVWRKKAPLEQVVQRIGKMMRIWQADYAIIEDSGMGIQILENYAGKLPAPLVKYTPAGKGGKDFRFDAACPWITSGKILFPKQAPWLADFVNELVAFPNGSYDDQVDALSQYTDNELKMKVGGTKPLRMRG